MSFTYNKVILLCGLSKIVEADRYAGLSSISGISDAYVCVLEGTGTAVTQWLRSLVRSQLVSLEFSLT